MDNTVNKSTGQPLEKQSVLPEGVRQQYLEAMGIQTWFDPNQDALQYQAQNSQTQNNKVLIDETQSGETQSDETSINKIDTVQNKPALAAPSSSPAETHIPVETHKVEQPLIEAKAASQPQVNNDASFSGLDALNLSIEQCQLCELHTTRKQAVCGEGNVQADLFIVIDSPIDDTSEGALFNAENKKMLQAMLNAIGFDLAAVFMSSLVKCKPPQQRAPHTSEVICCDEHLSSQIKIIKPQAILVLGELASQQLLVSQKSLTDLRLRHHQHIGIPVFASYHPHELFSSSETKRKVWADLLQIKRQIKR